MTNPKMQTSKDNDKISRQMETLGKSRRYNVVKLVIFDKKLLTFTKKKDVNFSNVNQILMNIKTRSTSLVVDPGSVEGIDYSILTHQSQNPQFVRSSGKYASLVVVVVIGSKHIIC